MPACGARRLRYRSSEALLGASHAMACSAPSAALHEQLQRRWPIAHAAINQLQAGGILARKRDRTGHAISLLPFLNQNAIMKRVSRTPLRGQTIHNQNHDLHHRVGRGPAPAPSAPVALGHRVTPHPHSTPPVQWLTWSRIADRYGVSKTTVRRWSVA